MGEHAFRRRGSADRLAATKRKPFDVFAEGLDSKKRRAVVPLSKAIGATRRLLNFFGVVLPPFPFSYRLLRKDFVSLLPRSGTDEPFEK